MPSGRFKSRTFRRVFVRSSARKSKIVYKRRKPQRAKCGICGALLKGVPREIPSKIKKLPKSKRRPQRPYGGNLCPQCTREKMKISARITVGENNV